MDDDLIRDVFTGFRPFTIKRMFGGKGMFIDGLMFGLIAFDQIWLKADEQSSGRFADAGSNIFSYEREGRKTVSLPYWQMPESAFDDADEAVQWARVGYDAALRAKARKRPIGRAKKDGR